MESNIKGLVAAGHEMASELKAECGAVDMRSVAKLLSDLATQLEVQLVRANALVAENAAMHETIEAVRSVADNSSGIAGWHLNGDIATWEEILPEINDIETPATDAFLAEVRAKAFNDLCAVFVKDATVVGLDDGDIVTVKEATDALLHCAEQLRKGGNQ
ncbi:hypothetical protein WKP56_002332 [Escherichia coli]|uniref:hypothetical protein n=1 Tax=Escherichia coli TaxID=562 RepID=UPI00025C7174|nr:hypothetical protein [Escherichia coli]EGO7492301.1 hypothetical protein [Escherichia coli]EHD6249246.1 hypothetical protein [Escherichia coli]EIG81381.1 hypothetical protein EC12741_1186 [Escherichia coli 1.2741]GDN74836.1 hypothetical protein BvCmsNSNP027_00897 [Escherichia coli]HAP3265930.1 hypothetical protein [Escherichia coli]